MLMFEPKNCGKIFTVCCGQASQSIGRGRIGRQGALDGRESRERRDKVFAEKIENAKKTDQKQQFSLGNPIFLAAGKLTFGGGGGITSKLAGQ